MKKESTHLIFDGKTIVLSPNLVPVFNFLKGIEDEVEGILNTKTKLDAIRKQVLGVLELAEALSKNVDTSHINLKEIFTEDPSTIAEKLEDIQTTRSEMIVLFANLETLMCLYLSYSHATDDPIKVKNLMMNDKNTKKFINKFLLTMDNPYYQQHHSRFKYVTSRNVRDLRNSLAHFFSVKGFALAPDEMTSKARDLESKVNNKVTFISPKEMYGLIQGASKLMLIMWNNDFNKNSLEFEVQIKKLLSVISKEGAVLVYDNGIKI
jgi:hypothetical protein